MKISIIVTTKSTAINVMRLLMSVNPFFKNIHEFILVNAGTPNMYQLGENKKVRMIDGIGTTRGKGRNLGIKEATGDVFVFLDDDTEITEKWIEELKISLKSYDIVAGYSPNPKGPDMNRVPVIVDGQDITYPTCNIAYKKHVLDKVGLFDEEMITAEDMDLNCRCVEAGYVIHYNPKMKVFHYHRTTLKGFAKQCFWNGYGRKQFNQRHQGYKHLHGVSSRNILRLFFGAIGYAIGGRFVD